MGAHPVRQLLADRDSTVTAHEARPASTYAVERSGRVDGRSLTVGAAGDWGLDDSHGCALRWPRTACWEFAHWCSTSARLWAIWGVSWGPSPVVVQ